LPIRSSGACSIPHLQLIAERGRLGWQKASGYHRRALAETAVSRYKRVIRDALRSRTESGQATEVTIAVHKPHARARTPEVRPDRLSDDGAQAWCVNSQLRATRQVGVTP